MDDFVEYSRRVLRIRLTSDELDEMHRLGRQRPTRQQWEAFFRRVVDRAEAGRPGDPTDRKDRSTGTASPQ